MMMGDDDEWDATVLEEIDKLVEAASTAKQASQIPHCRPAFSAHFGNGYVDDWDAGALEMQLSRQQQDHKVLPQKSFLTSSVGHQESESTRRLQSVASIKSPTTEVRPTCNGKSELWRRTNTENSGCVLQQTTTKQSQQEDVSSIEPSTSECDNLQVLYELHRIWCPKNKFQAGSELLTTLFMKYEKDLSALLGAKDLMQSRDFPELSETLTMVLQGLRSPQDLLCPLFMFLDSEDTQIVQSVLRVFRCLLNSDHTIRQRLFQSGEVIVDDHSRVEFEGNGWKVCTSADALYKPSSRVRFSSSRIQWKLKELTDPALSQRRSNDCDHRTCDTEEPAFELLKRMLQLALNNPDSTRKLEALSLIALCLFHTNPFRERFWYGTFLIGRGLISLLDKEISSDLQLEVVRILYLLLNCPRVAEKLCGRDDGKNEQATSLLEKSGKAVLEGVCACLLREEDTTQDYQLRKSAMKTLSYLMATTKNGAAALVEKVGDGEQTKSSSNIASLMISVLDFELAMEKRTQEDERCSLLPGALTVLYQLGSHTNHSSTIIKFLTVDADAARRSLNVIRKVTSVASRFCVPGSDSQPLITPVAMAKDLKSKILKRISDTSLL